VAPVAGPFREPTYPWSCPPCPNQQQQQTILLPPGVQLLPGPSSTPPPCRETEQDTNGLLVAGAFLGLLATLLVAALVALVRAIRR
jgi:hypothetical protein